MLLGVVLVLLGIVLASGAFALWSMRSDTGSAGSDRMSRQLLDCAEQGLVWGKQYLSTGMNSGTSVNSYLAANICSSPPASGAGALPCWSSTPAGPFPTAGTGTPPTGYPASYPYTQQIKMDPRQTTNDFEFTVGFYNNPGDTGGYYSDSDNTVIVYSRCTDLLTMQQRAVQAVTKVSITPKSDYTGQAGHGFRNQGNLNN